ncbi:MAG: PLP-dependent aminotransferase family protein [Gammaproteobacteria bacterium]|nr:PLP-dependent aminotransferase family protein [Gammaproteobacteria bacterium]
MKRRSPLWSQLFRLRGDAALTMQAQLRAQIIAAIGDGRIPADQPLPSSRDLAGQLGIARNTVVIVYQQLADDGYLIARPRHGNFPNPARAGPHRAAAPPPAPAADAAERERLDWPARMRLHPSRQRNISKAADWARYEFPFIYGQFDPSLFPAAEWRACCQQALAGASALDWAQDLITRDDAGLLEQIRDKVLPLRGVWANTDEIILTIGAQQAIYLLADLLFDETTEVGIENPGYPDARNIFSLRTARLRPLALDGHGLRVDESLRGCRFVYATPSHQSPTTITMPLERRLGLLRRAEADDFLIIEDDYESETSHAGLPNPALKSLDRAGRVIYVGSLSKTLAPGLRLGYIVAPGPVIAELRALRRLMVRHPAAFIQRSFAQFLALGHYDTLNRRLAVEQRERATALAAALAAFAPELHHPAATGGSSFWIEGPAWLDARRLAADAQAEGVLIEAGDVHFFEDNPPLNCFRLGISSIPAARIREGVRRLALLIERQRPP